LPERLDNRVLIPTGRTAPNRPAGDQIQSLTGQSMGSDWTVRLVVPPGADLTVLQRSVEDELAMIVARFSHWDPASELSRFNAAPAGTWEMSPEFWALITAILDIADDTNGAFDPTLGALVNLWGFGPPGPRPADASPLPADTEITPALTVSGWQKLRLNRLARAMAQPGGMRLDLSSVAKGHAVDRVAERLSREGVISHLVEIGGELRGTGVKPDAQPWWIDILQPPGAPGPRTVAALFDLSVATSGDYVRAFRHEGRTYAHTLDGRTGRPVDNGLVSVTVFHASAMMADAYATALTVMGPIEGPAFAADFHLAAQFVEQTSAGMVEHLTPGFIAMMNEGA
tara:strand:- start:1843 stop:2868 length:1026 start_codon:yes stop_codon:yes gene_type:complete